MKEKNTAFHAQIKCKMTLRNGELPNQQNHKYAFRYDNNSKSVDNHKKYWKLDENISSSFTCYSDFLLLHAEIYTPLWDNTQSKNIKSIARPLG